MIGKFGNDFKTKIAMTLHIGWSVEGVVGSEYKIDPTYLSPNIQLG